VRPFRHTQSLLSQDFEEKLVVFRALFGPKLLHAKHLPLERPQTRDQGREPAVKRQRKQAASRNDDPGTTETLMILGHSGKFTAVMNYLAREG
jgi:hypothetical protein